MTEHQCTFRAALRGAIKSLTVKFSLFLAVLPDALLLIQSNFPTVAPFIPEGAQSRVLQVIALVILILRVKTNASLADKGKQG